MMPPRSIDSVGELLPSEDATLLGVRRYASYPLSCLSSNSSSHRIKNRAAMDEAIKEVMDRFDESNLAWKNTIAHLLQASSAHLQSSPTSPALSPSLSSSLNPHGGGISSSSSFVDLNSASSSFSVSSPSPSPSPSAAAPFSTHFDALSSPPAAIPLPPPPPLPVVPNFDKMRDVASRARALQSYLRAFEYNHLGSEFHPVSKSKGFSKVCALAKDMTKEGLPIKCLEAVAIGGWLSRDWADVERFPLRFKSKAGGHSYWHIVLGLNSADGKTFGSVGLSRRCTLDYRAMEYTSLSALVESFKEAYAAVGHEIHTITIGLPLPRKEFSPERIYWHFLILPVLQNAALPGETGREWVVVKELLDRYQKVSQKLLETVKKYAFSSANPVSIAPSAYTAALFIPPAAFKAIGPIHSLVSYDSALVALVYKPAWPKITGGSGSDAATKGSNSDDSEEEDNSGGDSEGEIEVKSSLQLEEKSTTSSSVSKMQRIAERQERRKARTLVRTLKEKHRIPVANILAAEAATNKANAASSASALSLEGSKAGNSRGRRTAAAGGGRSNPFPSPSPVRSPAASTASPASPTPGTSHTRKSLPNAAATSTTMTTKPSTASTGTGSGLRNTHAIPPPHALQPHRSHSPVLPTTHQRRTRTSTAPNANPALDGLPLSASVPNVPVLKVQLLMPDAANPSSASARVHVLSTPRLSSSAAASSGGHGSTAAAAPVAVVEAVTSVRPTISTTTTIVSTAAKTTTIISRPDSPTSGEIADSSPNGSEVSSESRPTTTSLPNSTRSQSRSITLRAESVSIVSETSVALPQWERDFIQDEAIKSSRLAAAEESPPSESN